MHDQTGHEGTDGPCHQVAGRRCHEDTEATPSARQQGQADGHRHHKQQERLKGTTGAQQAARQHHAQGLQSDGNAQREVNFRDQAQDRHQGGKEGDEGE